MSAERDSQYSEEFLSRNVWTNLDNPDGFGGRFRVCRPYEQVDLSASPLNLTVNFREDSRFDEPYCNIQLGGFSQELFRKVFRNFEDIVGHTVKVVEVPADVDAHIGIVACSAHKAAGSAYYPGSSGSEIYIRNKVAGIGSVEDFLKYSAEYPVAILKIVEGGIEHLFAHEWGHAVGLQHTHNMGEQSTPGIESEITQKVSVMSYNTGECVSDVSQHIERDLLKFLSWDELPPQRTHFGPVDEINLRYAYTNGTSIERNQTEDTFPCPPKDRPSVFPTFLLSFSGQVALGVSVAATGVLAPFIKKKASDKGYENIARVAGAIVDALEAVTPKTPEETDGSWKEAGIHGTKDATVALGRSLFPLASLSHDLAYNVGSAFISAFEDNNLSTCNAVVTGSCNAVKTLITSGTLQGAFYGISRAIGTAPAYACYALASTTKLDHPEYTVKQRLESWGTSIKDGAQYAYQNPGSATCFALKGAVKAGGNAFWCIFSSLRGVRHILPRCGRTPQDQEVEEANVVNNDPELLDVVIRAQDEVGVGQFTMEMTRSEPLSPGVGRVVEV